MVALSSVDQAGYIHCVPFLARRHRSVRDTSRSWFAPASHTLGWSRSATTALAVYPCSWMLCMRQAERTGSRYCFGPAVFCGHLLVPLSALHDPAPPCGHTTHEQPGASHAALRRRGHQLLQVGEFLEEQIHVVFAGDSQDLQLSLTHRYRPTKTRRTASCPGASLTPSLNTGFAAAPRGYPLRWLWQRLHPTLASP